jgi:long-chain-fatty-acid--[acyl-carrier-protein] ligase
VADVVLAAAGRGVSAAPADVRPAPAAWFAQRDNRARMTVPPGATIPEVFLAQARQRLDQPLLLDQSSGVRTYRDIVTAVLILKPLLERVEGGHVGIMLPASVGASVFLLASQFAGKTPVMVNWTAGLRTIRHSLELLGVTRVITARALVTKLEGLGIDLTDIRDRFWFVEDLLGGLTLSQKLAAGLRSRLSWRALEAAAPREHAVVLFTSGSEALPKAVPLTHTNLLTNARDMLPRGEMAEGDVILGMLPPFHSFGLMTNVVLALCAGIRTAYHPIPTESAVLARLIETYGATVLIGTPTFLAGIVRVADDRQLATLRLVVTGAERCPDALYAVLGRRWPRLTVLEGYGITECSPVVSVSPLSAPVGGSIGFLLDSLTGAVVDLALTRRVATGETGLLLVRGPSVFPGYLHHGGESPFVSFEGHTWYRTGDLVRQDERGVLYFEGRLKRFVKLGGEMISLPAIESVVLRLAPDQEGGPYLAVEATGDPDSPEVTLFTTVPLERADANAAIRDAGFSPLHHIRQVVRVDAIPVLGTGKTDYRRLKEQYGRT